MISGEPWIPTIVNGMMMITRFSPITSRLFISLWRPLKNLKNLKTLKVFMMKSEHALMGIMI